MSDITGKAIKCQTCDGHGQVPCWSYGVKKPEECKDCGGSGDNWQYPSGAVARYYSGPFLAGASNPKINQTKEG